MVAERIKSLREIKGLTQSELAKHLGITRSSVNAWEQGISVPSTQYVVELARMFDVSTDYLLGVNQSATLPIDGLQEDEVQLLYQLANHFIKSHKVQDG